ncbi:protein of unknown function [Hyphomicrobium sp. 1Nfss2.1]
MAVRGSCGPKPHKSIFLDKRELETHGADEDRLDRRRYDWWNARAPDRPQGAGRCHDL